MSLWSTFYIGDPTLMMLLLSDENSLQDIDNHSEILKVDFSGGVFQPFLIMDDFSTLLNISSDKSSPNTTDFSSGFDALLWGDSEESGGYILKNDLVRKIGLLSDQAITEYSTLWNDSRKTSLEVAIKQNNRLENRLGKYKGEIIYWMLSIYFAYLFTVADHGSLPLIVKIIGPLVVLSIAIALRYAAWSFFQKSRPKRQNTKREYEYYDWTMRLSELREKCRESFSNKQSVVYLWSL